MNVILKELENRGKFEQAGYEIGVQAMLLSANIRHYNIDVNFIGQLMARRFERPHEKYRQDGVSLRERARKVQRCAPRICGI